MRAEQTRYAVPGWGEGELWMSGGVVLAHEFAFNPVSDTGSARARRTSRTDPADAGVAEFHAADSHAVGPCGDIGTESTEIALDTDPCLTPGGLVDRLAAFLSGEDVRFDDVPLELEGSTPFQHAVAATVRTELTRGEVASYGEIAALAGYPGAARAVGTFCARNRFMFLIPCHRVVGADGIGGYGAAGVAVKRRLLALEGVRL